MPGGLEGIKEWRPITVKAQCPVGAAGRRPVGRLAGNGGKPRGPLRRMPNDVALDWGRALETRQLRRTQGHGCPISLRGTH